MACTRLLLGARPRRRRRGLRRRRPGGPARTGDGGQGRPDISSGDQLERWLSLRGRAYEVLQQFGTRTQLDDPAADAQFVPNSARRSIEANGDAVLRGRSGRRRHRRPAARAGRRSRLRARQRSHPLRHLPHRRGELATGGLVLLAAGMLSVLSFSGPAPLGSPTLSGRQVARNAARRSCRVGPKTCASQNEIPHCVARANPNTRTYRAERAANDVERQPAAVAPSLAATENDTPSNEVNT